MTQEACRINPGFGALLLYSYKCKYKKASLSVVVGSCVMHQGLIIPNLFAPRTLFDQVQRNMTIKQLIQTLNRINVIRPHVSICLSTCINKFANTPQHSHMLFIHRLPCRAIFSLGPRFPFDARRSIDQSNSLEFSSCKEECVCAYALMTSSPKTKGSKSRVPGTRLGSLSPCCEGKYKVNREETAR